MPALARVVLRSLCVMSLCRIRRTVPSVIVAVMLWSTSIAALSPLDHPVCEARQHGCHTPMIAQCCCPEVGGRTTPATAGEDARREVAKPTTAVAALDFDAAGGSNILIAPPQAWFRDTVRRAGPPRSLSLLNSSFLI